MVLAYYIYMARLQSGATGTIGLNSGASAQLSQVVLEDALLSLLTWLVAGS